MTDNFRSEKGKVVRREIPFDKLVKCMVANTKQICSDIASSKKDKLVKSELLSSETGREKSHNSKVKSEE